MSTPALESIPFLERSASGETLPWQEGPQSQRDAMAGALERNASRRASRESALILAREIWDEELSPPERRLGRLLISRPEEFGDWLMAGVAIAGRLPELEKWRASVRQRQLARELARPWFESALMSPTMAGGEAQAKRGLFRRVFWTPSVMGSGFWARLANFAMSNALMIAAMANMALGIAKPAFWRPIDAWRGGAISLGIPLAMILGLFVKNALLKGVGNMPLWLWARAQLPLASWRANRRAQREARAFWIANGATEEAARKLSGARADESWKRRRARESASEEMAGRVDAARAQELGLDPDEIRAMSFRTSAWLAAVGGVEMAAPDAVRERGAPPKPSTQKLLDDWLRFERASERVDRSISLETAFERNAQKEALELEKESKAAGREASANLAEGLALQAEDLEKPASANFAEPVRRGARRL